MTKRTLKAVRPFDAIRQSSALTDPDYYERKLTRMIKELLSLEVSEQRVYFEGLDTVDRRNIQERLANWPVADAIRSLLEEAERCVTRAEAPNGAVCVGGKALDLILHSLGLDLKGTLGRKLGKLKKIAKGQKSRILAVRSEKLVAELLKMWKFLEIRNAGAHFLEKRPDVALRDAESFLRKVHDLYQLERERQDLLLGNLRGRRPKSG